MNENITSPHDNEKMLCLNCKAFTLHVKKNNKFKCSTCGTERHLKGGYKVVNKLMDEKNYFYKTNPGPSILK